MGEEGGGRAGNIYLIRLYCFCWWEIRDKEKGGQRIGVPSVFSFFGALGCCVAPDASFRYFFIRTVLSALFLGTPTRCKILNLRFNDDKAGIWPKRLGYSLALFLYVLPFLLYRWKSGFVVVVQRNSWNLTKSGGGGGIRA